MLGLELRELGAHAFGDLDLAGAAAARDLEADHRLAVEQRRRALLGDGVADRARPGRGGCGGRRRARSPCARAPRPTAPCAMVRTDCSAPPRRRGRPRPPAASGAAGARCRPRSRSSASMRAGSSSTRTSRSTPPTRATAPTPRTASRRLRDRVVDEPGQRLVVHARRGDRVGQDRRAGEVDLARPPGRAGRRAARADARHRVAHVVDRLLRRLLQAELDGDRRRAVLHHACRCA